MKKLLLSLLLVVIVAIPLATGAAAAKTTKHEIEFTIKSGQAAVFQQGQPSSDWYGKFCFINTGCPSGSFGGILREKDGRLYLSPMKGTLKLSDECLDDLEYDIEIKPVKEGEPLFIAGTMGYGSMQAVIPVEINIGGGKGAGELTLNPPSPPNFPLGSFGLFFKAIVGERYMDVGMGGGIPTVDGEPLSIPWPTSVLITGPCDGSTFVSDPAERIKFEGVASVEGRPLYLFPNYTVKWTSDGDEIGTGLYLYKYSNDFTAGTHIITLTMTDPDGNTWSDSISITISP